MLTTSPAAAPAPATLPLFAASPAPTRFQVSSMPRPCSHNCSGRAARSTAARCVPRWRPPSGLRCRRRLGVEGRLRSRRSGAGAFSSQIRQCHASPRGLMHRDARHARPPRRAAAVADAPLRGIRALPAILDADHAGLRRRRGSGAECCRPRSRTLRRHRPPGDLRRARPGAARLERNRRHPRRTSRPPVPRRPPSAATTPSRSTTGSIRRSGPASC